MPETQSGKLGILWSYDDGEYSRWLPECVEAIKTQRFVWWDVGWKINFAKFTFPIAGYIWATSEKQVKYVTTITSGSRMLRQPDQTLAKEVESNWIKLKLPFGRNDRLHEYLRNERNELTLLKLSEIEELNPALRLEDLTLWDGRPVSRPPQGSYRIRLP
jgi:hypothetical protein